MKEYYIIENEERQGPFTFEELKGKTILPDTHIWEEKFDGWKEVSEIPELSVLVKKTPPPIPKKKTPPPIPTVKKKKNPPPLPNALKTSPPPTIPSIGTEGETNNGKNSYGVSKNNIDGTDKTQMPEIENTNDSLQPILQSEGNKNEVGLELNHSVFGIVLTIIFIGIHLIPITNSSKLASNSWILISSFIGSMIWHSFAKYFKSVNDLKTAKWIEYTTASLITFSFVNIYFSYNSSFFDIGRYDMDGAPILGFFMLLPVISFIAIGIKLLFINSNHKIPLKRVAISAMLFIPLYMVFQYFYFSEYHTYISQQEGSEIFDSSSFIKINLIFLLPYYFLLFHFVKFREVY